MQDWLQQQFPEGGWRIEPASADASFRRYFRVTANGCSHILMDAPPQHEDCGPFLHVAQLFLAAGVHVPKVLAQNLEQGFLLLSDLGHTTYLDAINDSNADSLYMDAIDALIKIQLASRPGILPAYDDALLRRELQLFPEWYAGKHVQTELSQFPTRRPGTHFFPHRAQ